METCIFYSKIGACRHGDTCTRLHNRPEKSPTIILTNFYHNPKHLTIKTKGIAQVIDTAPKISNEEEQKNFDEFFEEVYMEIEEKYGTIEEMNVCSNLGRHLYGNVYIKFRKTRDASNAILCLNNRWFDGRPINAELSPVLDFHLACCPQFDRGDCERGDFCNFMHLKPISREIRHRIEDYIMSREEAKRGASKKKRESKRVRKLRRSNRRQTRSKSSSSRSSSSSNRQRQGSERSRSSSKLNGSSKSRSRSFSARSRQENGYDEHSFSTSRSTPDYGYSRGNGQSKSPQGRNLPSAYGVEKKERRNGDGEEVREGSLEKYLISTTLPSPPRSPNPVTSPIPQISPNNTNKKNADKSAINHANLVEAYFQRDSSPE